MNATAVIGLLYIAGFDLDLVREHLKTFADRKSVWMVEVNIGDDAEFRMVRHKVAFILI